MGLFGLVRGVGKTLIGVATGDGEMIVKGLKKTVINGVTTAVQAVTLSVGEHILEDDDELLS